jgi:tetratricopeptide (TPR) repeat protein
VYRVLCSLHQRRNDDAAFAPVFQRTVALVERLMSSRPDDPDNAADLGAVRAVRAVHLNQNLGTPESIREALEEFRRALAVLVPAYERHPMHLALAGTYGKVQGYTGLLLAQENRAAEGIGHLRKAVEVARFLAERDPADVRARIEHAEAHGRLGMAQGKAGDLAGALAASQRAVEIFQGLPEATRNEVVVQFNIAIGHDQLGALLRRLAQSRQQPAARQAGIRQGCDMQRHALALLRLNGPRRAPSALYRNALERVQKAVGECPASAATGH